MTRNANGQPIKLFTELGQFDSVEEYERAKWRIQIQEERRRQIDEYGYDDAHDSNEGIDHLHQWAQEYARRGKSLETAALIEAARTQARSMSEQIERVRALHPSDVRWHDGYYGQPDAPLSREPGCPTCRTYGPCATIRALDEAQR